MSLLRLNCLPCGLLSDFRGRFGILQVAIPEGRAAHPSSLLTKPAIIFLSAAFLL
jgi:hypothetical protein